MTLEKGIAFLDKLISDTKSEKISWERIPKRMLSSNYDPVRSFTATTQQLKIFLYCETEDLLANAINIFIEYNESLPHVELDFYEEDDFAQRLIRLFNLVYNIFPNVEKAIDDFLNS